MILFEETYRPRHGPLLELWVTPLTSFLSLTEMKPGYCEYKGFDANPQPWIILVNIEGNFFLHYGLWRCKHSIE